MLSFAEDDSCQTDDAEDSATGESAQGAPYARTREIQGCNEYGEIKPDHQDELSRGHDQREV